MNILNNLKKISLKIFFIKYVQFFSRNIFNCNMFKKFFKYKNFIYIWIFIFYFIYEVHLKHVTDYNNITYSSTSLNNVVD